MLRNYIQVLCILLSMAMIYLLTKLIIEKNENAISMTKILGYENREIASLYLLSTSIVVVVIDALTVAIGLYTGKELSEAEMERLREAAGQMSAKMRAVRIVSASSVSRRDLEERLVRKGEDPAQAKEAVVLKMPIFCAKRCTWATCGWRLTSRSRAESTATG